MLQNALAGAFLCLAERADDVIEDAAIMIFRQSVGQGLLGKFFK